MRGSDRMDAVRMPVVAVRAEILLPTAVIPNFHGTTERAASLNGCPTVLT